MSPTLRALLLAAATTGAAAFAPYTGPTLETIDQEFCGDIGPCQRIVGSKKPGPAPAVVLLPYSETQFDVTLGILKPTMDKIAEQGYSVALIGPDYYDYPDRAGTPFLPDETEAATAVLAKWTEVATAAYDAIKDGFCEIDDVDCSKIAVAGFSGGAGIASMLSTLPILSFGTIPALPITAQLTLAWAPLFGAGALGVDLPQYYHPVFVNGAPLGPSAPPPLGMFMNSILPPEKRFSVISEQDELFGNPTTASPIAIFPLQQVFSDYCKLEITTGDCIQSRRLLCRAGRRDHHIARTELPRRDQRQPDRGLLRAGRPGVAGRSRVRVAPGHGVRPLNAHTNPP